jgi:uncharacterized protein
VIFVDTNVFMYAVGGAHPLRDEARRLLRERLGQGPPLVTSAEVLQELLHAYLPAGRGPTLHAALELASRRMAEVWPVEADDVRLAADLAGSHPRLAARDLLHLACCTRRGVREVITFDRELAEAFRGG